jgi:uncharacterized protein
MSEEVAFKALELGARLNKERCGVVFFGGEPLLHLDLMQAVMARARAMEREGGPRFHFKVTTNGVLVDDAFVDFARRHDLLVALSLDGTRAAHDAHRRLADGSSSYDLVAPALQRLLAAKPYTSVISVVNPDTAPLLADSVSALLDQGCRYLIVSLNHAADWSEDAFAALAKQYQKLAGLYIEWTRAGRKFYLSPFEVKLASHVDGPCFRKDRCELARKQLSVDPEGNLFPCVQFTRAGVDSAWCIGRVDTGVDEAARERVHGESEADKAACSGCTVAARCNNTCGCLNWQTTGSVNGISPVLCKNEQLLMQAADEVGRVLYKERNPLFLHKHYNQAYPYLSMIEDLSSRGGPNVVPLRKR